MYLVGGATAGAASLLGEPAPPPVGLAVLAVVACLGLVWLAFPWEHAHWAWLDVAAIAATAVGADTRVQRSAVIDRRM